MQPLKTSNHLNLSNLSGTALKSGMLLVCLQKT